jgi:phosphatidylglycerophosphatase A
MYPAVRREKTKIIKIDEVIGFFLVAQFTNEGDNLEWKIGR